MKSLNQASNTTEAGHKTRILARVLVFWGGYLAILWLASFVKAKLPQSWGTLAWGLASSAAILPLTLLFLRRENRRARDIGLNLNRTSVLRLMLGVLLGAAIFSLQILVVAVIAGPIHFAGSEGATLAAVAAAIPGTLALACMEELGFRGYPLRTLVPGLGLWPAQGLVAMAFGFCHFAFGWSWATILLGVMPAALLFGMAAVASRGLAMPIGLHAGLNLAQSSLSGTSNRGFFRLVMEDGVRDKIAKVAPFSGVAVVLLATLGFWWWYKSHAGFKKSSDTGPGADSNPP